MIGVDKIGEIRRAYFEQHRSIKEIVRTLAVSRATVRKVVRGQATEFKYERVVQPTPKLGSWVEVLTAILEREDKLPKRERRSTQRLFEELRWRGYDGAHDSVHRFVKVWRNERARVPAQAYVPMSFAPGEAYQFDWSHETITLQGLPLTIKAAHMKLAHSRMPFVRGYFRETQELVFDAHDKAFQFYGGVCHRGIYDNIKTAVEAIFVGKARQYNRRFLQMCSHHLIEPVACTPASGWEKGQVENQVGNLRDRLFRPKPKVKRLAELNAWLSDQCIAYAQRTKHPEFKDRTIWEAFQEERASLMDLRGPFDGFVEKAVRASTTCLITADRNRYSVEARAAGRMVLVRSHAERIVVLLGEKIVADHPRNFKSEQIIYDPWHYLPPQRTVGREIAAPRSHRHRRTWLSAVQPVRRPFAVPPDQQALREHVPAHHHQSRLRRLAASVRRCQNDHRHARSADPPLRHRRDRQTTFAPRGGKAAESLIAARGGRAVDI
jgi:transposase